MHKSSIEMDLYTLLGIEHSASDSQIRKAYRHAALRTHPDKIGGSSQAFHKVAIAFEILSCPTARRLYDSSHHKACLKRENTMARKRPASRSAGSSSSSKRQRHLDPQTSNASCQSTPTAKPTASSIEFAIRTRKALSHLHEILQSLSPQSRLASVKTQLDENTRTALVKFIEKSRKASGTTSCHHSCLHEAPDMKGSSMSRARQSHDRTPMSGFSGVRATSVSHYKAYVDIKALRLYTRGHSTIEGAIDQHIALVRLRHALRAANYKDPGMWDASEAAPCIYNLCTDVLNSQGTSENELGLSVIVSLRADRWLGRGHHITSPMMSLAEALHVQARILRARSKSWMALRAEWVSLMLSKKRSLRSGLSVAEAQSRADVARQVALKRKLALAIRRVIAALDEERHRKARALNSKVRKVAREKRQKEFDARKALIARKKKIEGEMAMDEASRLDH